MFGLDYLSCVLTIVSTILIGKKKWAGFVLAGINSLLIGYIGFETRQTGFIPANIFCILIYAFSIRFWMRDDRSAGAEYLGVARELPHPGFTSSPIRNGASGKQALIIPFAAAAARVRDRARNRNPYYAPSGSEAQGL